MKFAALTATAAVLAFALAAPVSAQTADDTLTDTSKQAINDALGIDIAVSGTTDAERMAYFSSLPAEQQTTVRENCTTYIGREPTENANDLASEAAMSFCNVVVAPQ